MKNAKVKMIKEAKPKMPGKAKKIVLIATSILLPPFTAVMLTADLVKEAKEFKKENEEKKASELRSNSVDENTESDIEIIDNKEGS